MDNNKKDNYYESNELNNNQNKGYNLNQNNQQYNNSQQRQNNNNKNYNETLLFIAVAALIFTAIMFSEGYFRSVEVHDTSLSFINLIITIILSAILILVYKIYNLLKMIV